MLELANEDLSITVIRFGARIVSVRLGDGWEAALSRPDADYRDDPDFIGAALGRYANRIETGFEIDGTDVSVATGEGRIALHGGPDNFSQREWAVVRAAPERAVLQLFSPDGDQGYPGNLSVTLTVALEGRSLLLSYEAETDRPTPVNLSQHPYFRLGDETVEGHALSLSAEGVLLTDERLVPSGEVMPLVGGALDLGRGGPLAPRIAALGEAGGFDHCFLTPEGVEARLSHEASGRSLTVTSDAPAVQVYTGQGLHAPFRPYQGIAIEPQSPPDAPNHPALGDTILRPGEIYRRWIRYAFDWPGR